MKCLRQDSTCKTKTLTITEQKFSLDQCHIASLLIQFKEECWMKLKTATSDIRKAIHKMLCHVIVDQQKVRVTAIEGFSSMVRLT